MEHYSLLLATAFIFASYHFDWTGTGFENKTLWDWLQLLIIPLALAVIALLFNLASTRSEQKIANQRYEQDQKIALDRQREDLLQHYLDCMAELLLEKQLHSPDSPDEARNLARVRTITVLFQLDARRIGYVFAFLREAGLISPFSESIVSLRQANFNNMNWSQAVITEADLSQVSLNGTDLSRANLFQTNLRGADLIKANLHEANLGVANLRGANLSEANLRGAFLAEAKFKGTDLIKANLHEADLTEANLRGADLIKANLDVADLTDADLRGADLSRANLGFAILIGAKMQGVKGLTAGELEQCKARGAII